MDFNTELEGIKQKFLSMGFTEEKYNELLEMAAEEMMDTALMDLQEKDILLLEQLEKNLVAEPTTAEEANKNIGLIFTTAYGEKAEETRQKMLLDYLNTTLEQTNSVKDLLQRYQEGDPTAIAAIEAQKDNPDVQEFVKYMEENNPTPQNQQPPTQE